MTDFSATFFIALCTGFISTALAQDDRRLFGVTRGDAALPIREYPRHYCKDFEVSGLPLTTRVVLKSKDTADVQAKVSGFMLQCMDQHFKYRGVDGLMMMERSKDHRGKDVNCIKNQFEQMQVDFSDLTIKYNHSRDALDLASALVGDVYLEPTEACKALKWDQKDLDDDLSDIRRLRGTGHAAAKWAAVEKAASTGKAVNADVLV